jgi:NAD(P)-dependent dehydrogenase (short-subunit alcohol dehydrogenase family)
MQRYQGKKAVIIGGTSGMGLATAKMLIDGGARVLVTGLSKAGLQSAEKEIGKRAIVVASDARSSREQAAKARPKSTCNHPYQAPIDWHRSHFRNDMKAENRDNRVIKAKTANRSFGNVVRSFFEGWKRFEEAMDYTVQDYALDRIRALELRVLQLENARSTTGQSPPSAQQS